MSETHWFDYVTASDREPNSEEDEIKPLPESTECIPTPQGENGSTIWSLFDHVPPVEAMFSPPEEKYPEPGAEAMFSPPEEKYPEPEAEAMFSLKCINLPRSTNRRRFMEQQIKACGLVGNNWSFEEAIDGQELDSPEKGTYTLANGSPWSYAVTLSEQDTVVDLGILACTLSHVKTILAVQSTYCLIVEDDTFLTMSHLQDDGFDMEHIIQEAPPDWGIIQLGCNKHYTEFFHPWVSADRMYGAYAYLIRRECVHKIRTLLLTPNGTVHVNQSLSGEPHIYADFFVYGLVNKSTDFTTYTHTIFSTYNNKTTLDSTLHVQNTDHHKIATNSLIAKQIENRRSISTSVSMTNVLTVVEVSLCIPCHYQHLASLRILLLSLQLQECQPREVVISISSVPTDLDVPRLEELLQPLAPDIPLRIFVSHTIQYAGTNRNICIEHSLYDILIFIDADDLMYASRIRIVYAIMSGRPGLASLLHSYTRPSTQARSVFYAEMTGEAIYDLHLDWVGSTSIIQIPPGTDGKDGFGLKSNGFGIHNGHPVLRRSRLLQSGLRYTDDQRGQDAIFNRMLLQTLGRSDETMLFINTPLTYYNQDYSSTTFIP
jgi:GR25 family glycosyltransferase involved in LPS biosynthesis